MLIFAGILLSIKNNIHILWRDAVNQMSWDTIVPLLAVPLILGLACINLYATIAMLLTGRTIMIYMHNRLKGAHPRNQFFLAWTSWSVLFMTVIYETALPLKEVLPEENFLLVALGLASVWCFLKVKQRAFLNHVQQLRSRIDEGDVSIVEKEAEAIVLQLDMEPTGLPEEYAETSANFCNICRLHKAVDTFHCSLCESCVKNYEHHSFWLDCCISSNNWHYYIRGLIFAELALLVGSNLALTAVCRPVLVVRIFHIGLLLPQNCMDVYSSYELAIGFVSSIYAIVIAIYIAYVLSRLIFQRYINRKMQYLERMEA